MTEMNCPLTPELKFWNEAILPDKLGCYVYLLLDPEDNSVFYVGKGGGLLAQGNDRPENHLKSAWNAKSGKKVATKRDGLIISIWNKGKKPDLAIVARNLDSVSAHLVEMSLIESFRNFKSKADLTNQVRGHNASEVGLLTKDNFIEIYAPPVNPEVPVKDVWIFNISKSLQRGLAPYDACRGDWRIRIPILPGIAIGLDKGISRIVIQITSWEKIPDLNKVRFSGDIIDNNTQIGSILLEKDFRRIISRSPAWKRGRPIRVNFSGLGTAETVYNGISDIDLIEK